MKNKTLLKECKCIHCQQKLEQINNSRLYWDKLILSKMNITKTEKYNIRKCEPFSEIEFFNKMNKLSENYQNVYDNKPNKNKI